MRLSIAVTLSLALSGAALAQEQPAAAPSDPAREARLRWFREAKYGLFIHWGLYAIPAGEWKGRAVPGIGEWIMNRARIPVREYEALAAQFNPVQFDAEAWVAPGQGRGHEVRRHHRQAPRRLRPVRLEGQPLQHRGRHALQARPAQGAGRGVPRGAGSGSASTTRRPRTGTTRTAPATTGTSAPDDKKDFDRYLREQGHAAGAGAADGLRPHRPHLVRHAPDDDGRAGAALHRPRALAAARLPDRRAPRRRRRLRLDGRQRDPFASSATRSGRRRPRSTTPGASRRTTTTGSRPARSRSSSSTSSARAATTS